MAVFLGYQDTACAAMYHTSGYMASLNYTNTGIAIKLLLTSNRFEAHG